MELVGQDHFAQAGWIPVQFGAERIHSLDASEIFAPIGTKRLLDTSVPCKGTGGVVLTTRLVQIADEQGYGLAPFS